MKGKAKVKPKKAEKPKQIDFKRLIFKLELLNQRVCFICPIKVGNPERSFLKACSVCEVRRLIKEVLAEVKRAPQPT